MQGRSLGSLQQDYGLTIWVRLLLYPLTAPLTNLWALLGTLSNSRRLADGRWEGLNRFTAHHGLNSLTYWTQALLWSRHGRLGLAKRGSKTHAFYTAPSLLAYWRLAPMVPLLGMFGWLASHLLWAELVAPKIVVMVVLMLLVSSSWQAQTFLHQNYNALGWMLLPAGLLAISQGYWFAAALVWFGCSFLGFTTVIVAAALCLFQGLSTGTPQSFLCVLPALVKLALQILPALGSHGWANLLAVPRNIGLAGGALYTRQEPKWSLRRLYYGTLYLQFWMVAWWTQNPWQHLFLGGFLLFAVNSLVARFADDQSISLVLLSLASGAAVQSCCPWLWLSFWLLACPIPLLECGVYQATDRMPRLQPFAVEPLMAGMADFLGPVLPGQRVLMAFEDPKGDYGKLFDGYRPLLELPVYVATSRNIDCIPNWSSVLANNYEGAPDWWGREPEQVLARTRQWKADFVIHYQEAGSELSGQWKELGFEELGRFRWAEYPRVAQERPFVGEVPVWWLLRVPEVGPD